MEFILVTVIGGILDAVSVYEDKKDAIAAAEAWCEEQDPENADCAVYVRETPGQTDLPYAWQPKGKVFNDLEW